MRSIAVALFLASAFVTLLTLMQVDVSPLWIAPGMVLVAVSASSVATGGLTWLTVLFGSVGVLGLGWLSAWSPSLALILLSFTWLIPRGMLTRTQKDLVVYAAAAVPGAIVAGLITAHFATAPLLQHVAACLFAGAALAVSNVVVRVDAPVAHGLQTAGVALGGNVGQALRDAAEAHRLLAQLPPDKKVPRGAWRALLRSADTRVSLQGVQGEEADKKRVELDERILREASVLRDLLALGPPEAQDTPTELRDQAPETTVTPPEPARASPSFGALVP